VIPHAEHHAEHHAGVVFCSATESFDTSTPIGRMLVHLLGVFAEFERDLLTGLITCPDCGRRYLGTAARGRSRTYRYYTCFSRNRYGAAGCTGTRLDADALDDAVLAALVDFYATAETILTQVIAAAQHEFHQAHSDRHAELAILTAQITQAETAIERYHLAFENGTMDDTTAGPRIKDLRQKITQLTARCDDLTEALAAEPTAPPPGTIDLVRSQLHEMIRSGEPGERKRAIEALIHEVRITGDGQVVPVFKIPNRRTLSVTNQHEPATTAAGSRNGEGGAEGGTRTRTPEGTGT
jgi:site-specific DNA recombinase